MIQKLHALWFAVLLGLSSLLASCAGNMESAEESFALEEAPVEEAAYTDDELAESFESDTLNNEQLAIFQERAGQKLEDFIDYVKIISNKSFDAQLRLEASKQVLELFADTSVMVNFSIHPDSKTSQSIGEFLKEVRLSQYDSLLIKTDSVVIEPAVKMDNSYSGSISAKVKILGYQKSKIVFQSKAVHQATSIIQKTQKQFGNEQKMVWIVAIGEVKWLKIYFNENKSFYYSSSRFHFTTSISG